MGLFTKQKKEVKEIKKPKVIKGYRVYLIEDGEYFMSLNDSEELEKAIIRGDKIFSFKDIEDDKEIKIIIDKVKCFEEEEQSEEKEEEEDTYY